jgi:hypothetical protein
MTDKVAGGHVGRMARGYPRSEVIRLQFTNTGQKAFGIDELQQLAPDLVPGAVRILQSGWKGCSSSLAAQTPACQGRGCQQKSAPG